MPTGVAIFRRILFDDGKRLIGNPDPAGVCLAGVAPGVSGGCIPDVDPAEEILELEALIALG